MGNPLQPSASEMEDALVKKEKGMEWTEREKKMDVIFSDMTEKLACGLISFCNSFNPQRVIIGHEGWWIPDYYLLQAEEILNCRQIFRKYRKIPIVKAFSERIYKDWLYRRVADGNF